MDMYRQGDVLIVRTSAIPATATSAPRDQRGAVLAEGEQTGHAHAIADERATLLIEQAGEIAQRAWLRIDGTEPVALAHAEHSTIMLPPGTYEVRRQREYSPEEIRSVAD